MTGEDSRINRICVSSSINGCLSAIGAIKDTIYCVYEPKNIKEVYIYNDDLDKYVPDACITGELWVRNTSIIFVRTKVIKVIKSDIINKKWAYRCFKNEKYKYKPTEFSTECYNMKPFPPAISRNNNKDHSNTWKHGQDGAQHAYYTQDNSCYKHDGL